MDEDPRKSTNIFDSREQDNKVLSRRLANYLQALLATENDKTILEFLHQNRLDFYEPSGSQFDWQSLLPDTANGKPVPPIKLTVMFDNTEIDYDSPFSLKLICGEYDAGKKNLGNGIFSTTLETPVHFVPAEQYYSSSMLKLWDYNFVGGVNEHPSPPPSMTPQQLQGTVKEIKVRLELCERLKPKDIKFTLESGPDLKPCFIELPRPSKSKSPRLMITSMMIGSTLFFMPHPKGDGSLLLCHLTPGTHKHKDMEERAIQMCTMGGKPLLILENTAVFGPASYGGGYYKEWEGNEPQGDPFVIGSAVVVGVWSEARGGWQLFAQVFNSDGELVRAIKIFGPGASPMRRDYLSRIADGGS